MSIWCLLIHFLPDSTFYHSTIAAMSLFEGNMVEHTVYVSGTVFCAVQS